MAIFDSVEPTKLAGSLDAVTNAFGDRTRREVYFFVRSHSEVTVDEVAARLGIHPNVARHHLEKLVASGYLQCVIKHNHTVGRPSKSYRISEVDPFGVFEASKDQLLLALVESLLQLVDQEAAEKQAEAAGFKYGIVIAKTISPTESHKSLKSALKIIAWALTSKGFGSELDETSASLTNRYCPFGLKENVNPVLCAFEKGLVEGMLAALCGNDIKVKSLSRAKGDLACKTYT